MSTATSDRTLSMLPTSKVFVVEGHNPRGELDEKSDSFAELKASIEEHGVLQPILVGPENGDNRYPIIAGHRRHAAAQAVGLDEIPAQIADLNGDGFSAAVAENLIREDMTPLQEARAIRRLREAGMKQVDVAKALGKSERWVRDREKLLDVPESVQERVDAGDLPLEAIAHLVPLAKVRPEIAAVVVEHVAAGKARGGADLTDLADKSTIWSTLEQVAHRVGLQQIEEHRSFLPTQLSVDADDRQELKQLHDDLPQASYMPKPNFEFTDADAKEAKGEGALLEGTMERWGEKHKVRYITDPKLTAQLAKRKVPAMRKQAEKRVKEQADRGLGPVAGDDGRDDQAAADRKKQIEREERKREKARKQIENANKKLGERLATLTNPKPTDVDAVRLVCAMALGEEELLDEHVADGLGRLAPETYGWGDDVNEHDDEYWPGRVVLDELVAAKTAGECLKIVLRVSIAKLHALNEHGGASWFGAWPVSGDPLDVRTMIDDLAEKLDLLPPAQMAKVKERRKEAQERAKRLEEQRKKDEERAEQAQAKTRTDKALELIAAASGGITASDIAKAMKVKPNYLYRILGDLDSKGLIEKKGRVYTVKTEKGE